MIFNIYTLRGGRIRNPAVFINDARWLESKDAEMLLDIHNAPIKGQAAVQAAIERNVDQVQQILDQTIRLISHGLDARRPQRRSPCRPVFATAQSFTVRSKAMSGPSANQRGWFGSDVYDINPLSEREEAARLVAGMGGAEAVRQAAATAVAEGGLENWRWGLKLTSLLMTLDPDDQAARAARIVAARASGNGRQRPMPAASTSPRRCSWKAACWL